MRSWLVLVILMLMVLPTVHSIIIEGTHRNFDWEGDGAKDGPGGADIPWDRESCFACHEEGLWPGASRICEECHIEGGRFGIFGPFEDYVGPFLGDVGKNLSYYLRPDYVSGLGLEYGEYDYLPPMVFEHYFDGDDVVVPSQLSVYQQLYYQGYIDEIPKQTLSKCFGYNNNTGEGTCHGVSQSYSDQFLDGKFAFKTSQSYGLSEPYTFHTYSTGPDDNMPDTTDCLYCHDQRKTLIQLAWGSPTQVIMTSGELANDGCYGCHIEGGGTPISFHVTAIMKGAGASPHIVETTGPAGGSPIVAPKEESLVEVLFSEGVSTLSTDAMKVIIMEEDLRYATFFESTGLAGSHAGGQMVSAAYGPIVAPLMLTGLYPVYENTKLRSTTTKTTQIEGDPYNITAEQTLKNFGPTTTVALVIARGDLGADSMAAIAYAKAENMPILLTEPTDLPQVTLDAVRWLKPSNIIVAGGPLAVSVDIEAELEKVATVERAFGDTRVETAVALAEKIIDPSVVVVTDFAYPSTDAAIMSYLFDAPLLYTNSTDVQPALAEYLVNHKTTSEGNALRIITIGVGEQAAARIAEIVGTG